MMVALVRSESDSRDSLHEAGITAVRCAISNAWGAETDSVSIEKDALGKPSGRVAGMDVIIPVSISHSFPYAFSATALDGALVGVDIERIRNFAPSTWEAFLTSAEKKIVADAAAGRRAYLRTLSWSLKESVLKALGVGLWMHPQRVDVSRVIGEKKEPHAIEINGILRSAVVRFWRIDSDFVATVVSV